jgi:phage terminase large subunit-like protein
MGLTRTFRRKYPHVSAAITYAEQIVAKKLPACKYVRQACERQLNDLDRADFVYEFDVETGERVCRYVETLPHIKGDWAKRGELLRLESWQSFNLSTIFGWRYREDIFDDSGDQIAIAGKRRFRTVYDELPRKQSKSTMAAAVGLYMVEMDGEHGAEVYSAATTRNQAKIVFNVARQMALRRGGLGVRMHNIHHLDTVSLFEPLHAQGETLDGYNIHCAINDELHAWHKRAVYDVIETATGARQQPMIFNITTAGSNLEGICFELRGYAVRILNRVIEDESFFAIIYTIDDEDRENWQDKEVWKKANPNYGVSVYPWDLESMAKKAKEVPSELNAFLTKRLDVWVNSAVAWMDMAAWQRCYDPTMKIEDFAAMPCYGGLDLASKIDVNSLAVIYKVEHGGKDHYYVFMRHWLPEAAIASDRFGQYDGWVRMGALTKTQGNVIDTDEIEADIFAVAERSKLVELGIDPGHNSTQVGVHVAQKGITVVDVRPTVMNFSEPMKWLEAWVKDGTFHFCDPVLTWMVSNVVAKRDNKDNIYPRKESVVRKIDGVIAVLIAINRMKGATEAKKYQMLFV